MTPEQMAAHMAANLAGMDEAMRKNLGITARHIKRQWQDNIVADLTRPLKASHLTAKGSSSALSGYAGSITVGDITTTDHVTEVEIEPVRGKKQYMLGVLLEYGTPTSPPHKWGEHAAAANARRFSHAITAAALEVFQP